MQADAIDRVPDQLLTPLVAFLMAAINADVGAVMVDASGQSVPAVTEAIIRPQDLRLDPEGNTRLSAYRVRSKRKRVTFGHLEHMDTIQFDYVTPACGSEQLEERWPVLDQAWTALTDALEAGSHAAWESGESVLERAGITWIDVNSALKTEFYIDGEGFAFPGFLGTIDIQWRGLNGSSAGPVYPALSFTSKLYVDGNVKAPDAVSVGYTALGQVERDTDTIEETGEAVL